MTMLTIGELAEQVQINAVTLRYYEKRGLIPHSNRSKGGHRLYPETITPILQFIKNAQSVGFTLDEIQDLLKLQTNKKSTGQHVKNYVLAKMNTIKEKIAVLQNIHAALKQLTNSCDGKMSMQSCPIMATLLQKPKTVTQRKKLHPKHK